MVQLWGARGATPYVIIDSEISFIAGPTTDSESIARPMSLSIASLSSQEYTVDGHVQCRIHRRRCQLRAHRERSCDLLLGWNILLGLTAIDVPAIRGTSWILVDVFMRANRVTFDETECTKHFSRRGGHRAVECGDDPPGGLSTLSAHHLAHGGVVPHSSSSELSAHQMPARDDLWKGKPAMMAAMIPRQKLSLLFGAKTGKGRVRGRLPHHPRLGKGVERGHMMCPPHLPRIVAFSFTFHFSVKQDVGVMSSDKTIYDNVYNVITDDSTCFKIFKGHVDMSYHRCPGISRTGGSDWAC